MSVSSAQSFPTNILAFLPQLIKNHRIAMRNITFLKVPATKNYHQLLNPEHIYEAKENKNQP